MAQAPRRIGRSVSRSPVNVSSPASFCSDMPRKTTWSACSPWRSTGRPLAPSVKGGVATSREPGVDQPASANRGRMEPHDVGTAARRGPVPRSKRSDGNWPVCGFRSHETAPADADGVDRGAIVAVGAAGEAVGAVDGADVAAAVDGDALGVVGPQAAMDSPRIARLTMGRRRVAWLKTSSGDWERSGRTRRSGQAPARQGSSPAAPLPTAL